MNQSLAINDDAYAYSQGEGEEVYYDLSRLRTQFQDFMSLKASEIEEQKEARRYYHCVQWTKEQINTIRARGQPVTTKNEYARKVNAIVGLLERLKQDPKAFPNTPKHADGADLSTETLRYAFNTSGWDAILPQVGHSAANDGIGGVEFDLTEGDKGDREVGLGLVQPDTFFYDPRSFELDFSDALFMGTSKWVDIDVLREMFPDRADEINSFWSSGSEFTTDSDRDFVWTNSTRKTIRAVDHWYLCKGKWKWCFHIGGIKLAEGVSPWVDEKGKTGHKFEMFSASVDHEGDRYGFLRNLKTNCDEVNQRTSRLLHISNSRRVMARKGAVKDVETARREWARADGWVEFEQHTELSRDLRLDDTSQDFQGQLLLLQEAKNDIDRFGPNAAQLGQGEAGKSGRAIALLQQAGLAELGPFMIAFRNWKLRCYRKMWNAIQRNWTAERWIRVTDSEDLTQFIQLNGVTVDEYGQPALVNALGSLDVDIQLDEGGDVVTTMAEALETLQSAIAAGMPIPPDILVDLLPIRQDIKKRIRERMEKAQQPDPMQQQAKKVALDQEQAKTDETRAKTGKAKADTFKSMADAVDKIANSPLGVGGLQGLPDLGGQNAPSAGFAPAASGPPAGPGSGMAGAPGGFAPPPQFQPPAPQPRPVQQPLPF